MPIRICTLMLALGTAVAGCGDTGLERGLSGGAIGAGVGEVVADEPVAGAAIGAGAGLVTD